jgi:glycine dehydrogenase subunit 2
MEKIIFDYSKPGRRGYTLPALDLPKKTMTELIPDKYLRSDQARLPEVAEPEVVRHFIKLSILNHHVDKGFYPLGSCTMKYNPKINEDTARLPGFSQLHPLQPDETVQGALRLMWELGRYLGEIAGLDAVSLQPAAGAQGELTGIMMVRKYHEKQGNPRTKVLIPDSAHGTNPASVTLSGYTAVEIKSNEKGLVDPAALKNALDQDVACLMLTNPNTLGLFESEVAKIAEMLHAHGSLLYMDGANLNALLGIQKPGASGIDLVHFNLHKTFSTPHGGGGPGSGPVGVKKTLEPFLPVPAVVKDGDRYTLADNRPDSVGKIQGFFGNFLVMVRAYTYIRMLGARGLKEVAEAAIINANYLKESLKDYFTLPHPRPCMHEFVLSGTNLKQFGIKTLDVAKRLLDFGFHAPTVYFPLIVPEALMIEPTETESKESLDAFIEAMVRIAHEAQAEPELLHRAPTTTPVGRLDEAKAAKELDVRFRHH